MSSPSMVMMLRMCRSSMSMRMGVPARSLPMPMWCRRLLWRRVSFPSVSTLSVRTRKWALGADPLGPSLGRLA